MITLAAGLILIALGLLRRAGGPAAMTLTEHYVRWTERDTLHPRTYRAETGHWYDERGREWAAPYAICRECEPRPLSEVETARWWQERLDEHGGVL